MVTLEQSAWKMVANSTPIHAAAHNDDAVVIPGRNCQQAVAADDARQVDTRNVWHQRLRTGGDDDILRPQIFLSVLLPPPMVFPGGWSPSFDKGDVVLSKQLLDLAPVTAHRTLLIFLHFRKIEGDKIGRNTEPIPCAASWKNVDASAAPWWGCIPG